MKLWRRRLTLILKLAEEVLRDGEQGEIEILRRQIPIIPEKYQEQ